MNVLEFGPADARPCLRRRALLSALSTGVVLAGCSVFEKEPATVEGTISASANINVGALNHASPVMVRLYELKQSAGFEAADFLGLFQREQETLGPDLVARSEYVVQPSQVVQIDRRPLAPETRAIGVVAAFQNVERATWRALYPVRLNKRNKIQVRLEGMTVKATAQP